MKVGITLAGFISTEPLVGGFETNTQLYIRGPPGLVDPLPFNVTVLPTLTVWLGPAFALNGPATAWNVNAKKEELNGTLGFTNTTNVFWLVTWLFAGTGANVRLSSLGTTRTMKGFRVDAVAVTE